MKLRSIVMIFLFLSLPSAFALVPQEVSRYCSSFDLQACNAHATLFTIDACKSMVKCVADVDMDTLAFRGCRTVLYTMFDDCKRYPSTLCYDGVAYDTSHSETCGQRQDGARFRMVDACGNPTGFGPCLQLDTCDEVTVSPHTGASIIVHENCETIRDGNASEATAIAAGTMQEESTEEPEETGRINDARPSSSSQGREEEGRARTGPQPPPQESIDSETVAAETLPAREQASDTTTRIPRETTQREIVLRTMTTPEKTLATGLAIAVVLLILFIMYWYFWRSRQ